MANNLQVPTVEDVERIRNMQDPVMRNLQITQCYHELSLVLAGRTGLAANWCTFATWASKQAGQTIRKEDLARLLERRLRRSPSTLQASGQVAAAARVQGGNQLIGSAGCVVQGRNYQSAIDRASDAVGRGNQKVFEEIGYEFARFYRPAFSTRRWIPRKRSTSASSSVPGSRRMARATCARLLPTTPRPWPKQTAKPGRS